MPIINIQPPGADDREYTKYFSYKVFRLRVDVFLMPKFLTVSAQYSDVQSYLLRYLKRCAFDPGVFVSVFVSVSVSVSLGIPWNSFSILCIYPGKTAPVQAAGTRRYAPHAGESAPVHASTRRIEVRRHRALQYGLTSRTLPGHSLVASAGSLCVIVMYTIPLPCGA